MSLEPLRFTRHSTDEYMFYLSGIRSPENPGYRWNMNDKDKKEGVTRYGKRISDGTIGIDFAPGGIESENPQIMDAHVTNFTIWREKGIVQNLGFGSDDFAGIYEPTDREGFFRYTPMDNRGLAEFGCTFASELRDFDKIHPDPFSIVFFPVAVPYLFYRKLVNSGVRKKIENDLGTYQKLALSMSPGAWTAYRAKRGNR